MQVTRGHRREEMVFGVIEHVETEKIEPPSSLRARERSVGFAIATMMHCPDREESRQTFSHQHGAEMEL
jgi:hypothetical protein